MTPLGMCFPSILIDLIQLQELALQIFVGAGIPRRSGYLDEQFNMLLGHTKPTTTGRYGIVPQGGLSERVKMIEAVEFPGLS
jgi:hypothetical protein